MPTKITELPASGTPATDDVLAIDDVSVAITKKVTIAQIIALVGASSSGNDPMVRYVTKQGNDANSGASWGTAFLTVRKAIEALPTNTLTNGHVYHYGRIYVGRGQFDETVGSEYTGYALDISANIEAIGSGTASGARGTRIRLANSQNKPLVGSGTTASDGHGVVLRDLVLDGNKANQATATGTNADVWHLGGGGFIFRMENLYIQNAKRFGIRADGGVCNIHATELNFAGCGDASAGIAGGGAILVQMNGSPMQITWIGGQIDQCGHSPVQFEQLDGSSGDGMCATLRDIKWENNGGPANVHVQPITFKPRPSVGGSAVLFVLESLWGNAPNAGTDGNPSFVTELAGSGIAARWEMRNVHASPQYAKAFVSLKTGQSSATDTVGRGHFRGTETFNFGQNPVEEWMGLHLYVRESGTPEGVVTAPPGSLCLLKTGAMYLKTTGTGNTGWTLK